MHQRDKGGEMWAGIHRTYCTPCSVSPGYAHVASVQTFQETGILLPNMAIHFIVGQFWLPESYFLDEAKICSLFCFVQDLPVEQEARMFVSVSLLHPSTWKNHLAHVRFSDIVVNE